MNLGLDSTLFQIGETSAPWLIWQYAQNIANVLLIIILLVIIFSQLTGWGIDNYGIKKMLPKLVVMAVVINLSFYICQLAVDVSNIFGKGIVNIANDIYTQVYAQSATGEWLENGLATLFAVALGGATVAGTTATVIVEGVLLGAAFWIPLLFLAAAVLVVVVIFYLTLGLRQVLAVLCVTIAPLALVCYILPNTKNLYKKWFDAFKGVIIVYPLCAALFAASKLMRLIAYSANGTHMWMIMAAWLSQFVPLVFAPTLIKKALTAFGDLGTFANRMGDRIRSGLDKAQSVVRGSEYYKDRQREALSDRAKRSNQRMIGNAQQRIRNLSNVQNRTRGQERQLARAQRRVERFNNDPSAQRRYALNRQRMENQEAADVEAARVAMREETGNYDNEIMSAQLGNLMGRIDSGKATQAEMNKAKAIMSQLAQQTGGASKLANAVAQMSKKDGSIISQATGESARFIGNYMAQNAKVRQALENKHRWGAQRVSDIAAGVVSANMGQEMYDNLDSSYLEYMRRERAYGRDGLDYTGWLREQYDEVAANDPNMNLSFDDWRRQRKVTTTAEDIARNVLDKDKEFVSQKGGAVARYASLLPQERINKMAANHTLFGYGDVADGVETLIKDMAIKNDGTYYVNDVNGNGPEEEVEVMVQRGKRFRSDGNGGLGREISDTEFENYQSAEDRREMMEQNRLGAERERAAAEQQRLEIEQAAEQERQRLQAQANFEATHVNTARRTAAGYNHPLNWQPVQGHPQIYYDPQNPNRYYDTRSNKFRNTVM